MRRWSKGDVITAERLNCITDSLDALTTLGDSLGISQNNQATITAESDIVVGHFGQPRIVDMHDMDGVPTLLGGPNSGVTKSGLYYRCVEAVSVGGCNQRELVKSLTELEISGGSQGNVYQHIITDRKGVPTKTEMIYAVGGVVYNNTPWQYADVLDNGEEKNPDIPEGGGEFYRRLARVVYNCKYPDGVETYKRFKVIETPEMMLPPLAQTALNASDISESDCTVIDKHHLVLPLDGNTIPVKGLGANGGIKFDELDCSRVLGIQAGIGLHLNTSADSTDTESTVKNFPSTPICQKVNIPIIFRKVQNNIVCCNDVAELKQSLDFEINRRGCGYWDYDVKLTANTDFATCYKESGSGAIIIPIPDGKSDIVMCPPLYLCCGVGYLDYTCWFNTSDNSNGSHLGKLNLNETKLNTFVKGMIQAGCNVSLDKTGRNITINVPSIGDGQGITSVQLNGLCGVSVENQQINGGVYSADIYGTLYCFDGDWFCISGGSRKKMVRLNTSKIQEVFERMANCVQVEINVNGVLEETSEGRLFFDTSGGLCGLNTTLSY